MGMNTYIRYLVWRLLLISVTLSLSIALVAAQEATEGAEAVNFGPIWFILLSGLGVIVLLGVLVNSRNSNSSGDHS